MTRATCFVVSLALLVGCSRGSESRVESTTAPPTTRAVVPRDAYPAYAEDGPNVVAISTLKTGSNRTIEVMYPGLRGSEGDQPPAEYDLREALHDPESPPLKRDDEQMVTLPAYRDLPPADGQFPVVLFSHGYGTVPLQTSTLEIDLAAWGFVVIAPDHVERDTLAVALGDASIDDNRDARTLLQTLEFVAADPTLGPLLDLDHVAVVGHSEGGATAIAALALPEVDTAVAWASTEPSAANAAGAEKPVMLIGAEHDLEYGTEVQERIYAGLTGPRRLVLLGGGIGHATFVDECAILWSNGLLDPSGEVPIGNPVLDLAQNGCHRDEVDPAVAWKTILHLTIAHLRDTFGFDLTPMGLGDGIAAAFPKVPLTYVHDP